MNKNALIFLPIAIIAVGLWMWADDSDESQSHRSATVNQTQTSQTSSVATNRSDQDNSGSTGPAGDSQERSLTNEESFVIMAKSFLEFAGTGKTPEDFVAHLQSLGLKPIIAEDKQDAIEDLTIIRTENTLPGVRYIHAQFDGDGVQELQHLSFEIPKGPDAHQKGIDLIKKTLGLGKRVPNTIGELAIFKRNGYVIWLKKLSWEDMMDDPFNAYERSDEGNIRVAIERDIHAHHTHGH